MRSFIVSIDGDPANYVVFNVGMDRASVGAPTDAELNDIADRLFNSDYANRIFTGQAPVISGISVVEDRQVTVT